MKKMTAVILFSLFFLALNFTHSQISPPGLGKANTANWLAFGLRQELDTIEGKGWQSMTYVGMGRKSNPDNYNMLFKPAIFVLNQEFYHQFHRKLQYSFALSYRRQDEYFDQAPYGHESPAQKQEFRLYGRFSYIFKAKGVKLVPTFRQEFRKFYTPDFNNPDERFQLRSRFRLQLTVNLDRKKIHRLTTSSEQLFSISQYSAPAGWGKFQYHESRFSLYYSFSPKKLPLIFSLGYMNNLLGTKKPSTVHYMALDMVWENPFKLRQRQKENTPENLE